MMFYHIIWCPSIPLCVYNCRLFSFHYYVTSFAFYQKQNVRAFIMILRVTMKAVAFDSSSEINGFVEKLVIFSWWIKYIFKRCSNTFAPKCIFVYLWSLAHYCKSFILKRYIQTIFPSKSKITINYYISQFINALLSIICNCETTYFN